MTDTLADVGGGTPGSSLLGNPYVPYQMSNNSLEHRFMLGVNGKINGAPNNPSSHSKNYEIIGAVIYCMSEVSGPSPGWPHCTMEKNRRR